MVINMSFKHITWLPAVVMMGIIFFFSSKPASSSGESSMAIANGILNVYETITDNQFQEEYRYETMSSIDHIVRKGAHFIEYALLSISIGFYIWNKKKNRMMLILLSIGSSAIYATTDEFHQLFVPGRSGQIQDVMIDTAGAAAGILFFCLILALVMQKRAR